MVDAQKRLSSSRKHKTHVCQRSLSLGRDQRNLDLVSVHCLMNPVLGQRIRTLRGAYGSNSWARKTQRACKQRRWSL